MRTYRELIQDIIDSIDKVYDRAGALRDTAATNEKNIFNETRRVTGELLSQWRHFGNSLSDGRAEMIAGEWPDGLK